METECNTYEMASTTGISLEDLWNHIQQCDSCRTSFEMHFGIYNKTDASMPLPGMEAIPEGIRDEKAFLAAFLTAQTFEFESFKLKFGSAIKKFDDPEVMAWMHSFHESLHRLLFFIAEDALAVIVQSEFRLLMRRYSDGRELLGDHFAHAIGLLNSAGHPPDKVLKKMTKGWEKLLRPFLTDDA